MALAADVAVGEDEPLRSERHRASRGSCSNYTERASATTREQFIRSFGYAGTATVLCILIGYPMAYVIAFRGGRCRNVLLGLVVVPFFTSFLIRTLAWQNVLSDNGPVCRSSTPAATGLLESLGIDERRPPAGDPRRR